MRDAIIAKENRLVRISTEFDALIRMSDHWHPIRGLMLGEDWREGDIAASKDITHDYFDGSCLQAEPTTSDDLFTTPAT